MKTVRGVICWDMDGVLIDRDRSHHSDWHKELTAWGVMDLYKEFEKTARWQACLKGQDSVHDALQELAGHMNINPIYVNRILRIWHGRNSRCNHELMEHMLTLRTQGWKMLIASNQDADRAKAIRNYAWLNDAVDFWGFSCDLGFAKPERGFYTTLLQKAKAEGHLTVMIDDKPENLVEPAALWWKTHHYTTLARCKKMIENL